MYEELTQVLVDLKVFDGEVSRQIVFVKNFPFVMEILHPCYERVVIEQSRFRKR